MEILARSIFFLLNFILLRVDVDAIQLRGRTAGGTDADEGEFPYHALFALDAQVQCGGALISRQHVLTSAHCFLPILEGRTFLYMAVILGSIHLLQGQSYAVKRISYFKEYAMSPIAPFLHDIGLIHLHAAVIFSPYVAPIRLPPAYLQLPVGLPVVLSGFGSYFYSGPKSPILRKLALRIFDFAMCRETHKYTAFMSPVICASFGPGFGSCSGDSGGPLVDIRRKTLLGVLSGGTSDCNNGISDVYTDVSHYIPYILEEMNYNPSNPYTSSSHPGINFYGYIPIILPYQRLLGFPHHFLHIFV